MTPAHMFCMSGGLKEEITHHQREISCPCLVSGIGKQQRETDSPSACCLSLFRSHPSVGQSVITRRLVQKSRSECLVGSCKLEIDYLLLDFKTG